MKLTLRKANALQNAIQDHVKTIDISTSVKLNEFQDVQATILKANVTALTNDLRRSALTQAIYEIRKLTGRANVECGVADLLTDAALVDKRLGQLKGLSESTVTEDLEVLLGKVAKLKDGEAKSRIYGYNDTIDVGILSAHEIEEFKTAIRELKKEKQKINDKVLELNVKTEIELDDKTVALLQKEQLI